MVRQLQNALKQHQGQEKELKRKASGLCGGVLHAEDMVASMHPTLKYCTKKKKISVASQGS